MSIPTTQIGNLTISRLIVGGNPISGVSHQGVQRDLQMRQWYTCERIKDLWRSAEAAGVTACIARSDRHIQRLMAEYRDEGGKITWIAQSAPEMADQAACLLTSIQYGASAAFIHGGIVDKAVLNGRGQEIAALLDRVRAGGVPVGIAAHDPSVIQWAAANLKVDFFMCSYYNPSSRRHQAAHDPNAHETFNPIDRDKMVATIPTLPAPAIHYKIMAAGRTPPAEAFAFAARQMRPQDAACVGIFSGDNNDMIRQNAQMFVQAIGSR